MVDASALAVDVIRQVGPGGEYLTSPHTLRHCRSLLFTPGLSPPRVGDPKALEALIQKSLAKLENAYTPANPAPEVQSAMDDYMSACGVPSTLLARVRQARQSCRQT